MSGEVDRFFDDGERGIVPQGYPVPQTEVDTARDVDFPATPDRNAFARGDNTIDAIYVEIGPQEEARSVLGDVAGKIWDSLAPAFALGADEIVKAMYTGNAFTFHGSTFPEPEQERGPAIEPLYKEGHEMEGREM